MSTIKLWTHGLRGKLLVSAFLPVFAFIAIAFIAETNLNKIGDQLDSAYSDILPNVNALGQMGMQRARIGYFVWAAISLHDEPKGRAMFIEKTESAYADYKKGQDFYESQSFAPGEAEIYEKVKVNKAEFYRLTDLLIADLKKNTPEADAEIKGLMNGGRWHVLATDVQKMMEDNIKLYGDIGKKNTLKAKEDRKAANNWIIGISAFCCVGLFGVLMFIAYRVSNSIGAVASQLNEAETQVSTAIAQLSTAGQMLSQASTASAGSLQETVASLEEMSSMVKMNSSNAGQAASLSISSRDAAEEGQREIHSLIESMHDISKSSKKIEEIISVIDDIAFQTNLLALNASVEAARAGEQGKGFAVVAEAVRTLAQRSAVAAKDIASLIKESVDQVEKGSTVADRSGEVLNNIVNSVKKVSDLNSEISAASSEQTTGIQQISKAMNQLDESTQSNAASSEEIAASSEEISAQAMQMRKLTMELNQVIFGAAMNSQSEDLLKVSEPASSVAPKPSAKVVPFKRSPSVAKAPSSVGKKPQPSAAVIPFDDDEDRKVGTTDGF